MSTTTHLLAIRQAMPATTAHVYLNTGTFGPLPDVVPAAMQAQIDHEWQNGRLGSGGFDRIIAIYQQARQRCARLLNADESEIALTDNTGEGLNIICYGLNWQAGDEIITTNHEHFSALAPLYQIRDRFGAVIRTADLGPQATRPTLEAIQEQVTPRTRLIVLSHVTWLTGAVLDVRSVGQWGRAHGIPVLVDGAQSAGNIPVDVKALDVDFYAIPMQKWLCGPDGTGALYARAEAISSIASTYVGYWSTLHDTDDPWTFRPDAARFEVGGRQTAGVAGQEAALRWLEETVTHQWIFTRITMLSGYANIMLQTVPSLKILSPRPGSNGILSFSLAGHTPEDVVQRLQSEHNIYIRSIPSTPILRVSIGFYNTEDDIYALVKALKKL